MDAKHPLTVSYNFLKFVTDPEVVDGPVSQVPGVGHKSAHIFEQYGMHTVSNKVEKDIKRQDDEK